MDLNSLKDKFSPNDIEWRVQSSGVKNGKPWARVLAYVTNRAIQDRLDDVCSPQNWRNEYAPAPTGGVMCGISIKVGDEWVTKWDGAENTQIEAVKGGLSGAMKRAAVQWGIGRYLYSLPTGFAEVTESGAHSDKAKDKQNNKDVWFRWNPPKLPDWAMPNAKVKIDLKQKKEFTIQVREALSSGDDMALKELWAEWDTDEKAVLWKEFNSQERSSMKELMA